MAGRARLAGSGEVTREGARLPASSAVPDRAGQLPPQTTSLGSSVGPPSFVKCERRWTNSPQHPPKANSRDLPCWVVGQEGPESCEDRSGKPVCKLCARQQGPWRKGFDHS